jgi:hypothetical protein
MVTAHLNSSRAASSGEFKFKERGEKTTAQRALNEKALKEEVFDE